MAEIATKFKVSDSVVRKLLLRQGIKQGTSSTKPQVFEPTLATAIQSNLSDGFGLT